MLKLTYAPVGKALLLLYPLAFIIVYGQAYLGVHYPVDIAAGTLFGILVGYLAGKLFNRKTGLA